MRTYLVAGVLVVALAGPAFAEQFWLAYDGKRCEVFSHKPPPGMNIMGTYNSQHDAQKAKQKKDVCKKG
jgi:hypothetical protein